MAPTDNDELNALKAAGNPFPLELGYEHGFDEVLRGEEVPPRPESLQAEPTEAGDAGEGAGETNGTDELQRGGPVIATRLDVHDTSLVLSQEPDVLPE